MEAREIVYELRRLERTAEDSRVSSHWLEKALEDFEIEMFVTFNIKMLNCTMFAIQHENHAIKCIKKSKLNIQYR